MPTIREYIAPDRTLRPDEKGFAAFETMGRRVGGLYNQAGEDQRRIGQLQDEAIRERGWPYNILALEARDRANGGVRVNLGRSSNSFPGAGGGMAAHHATLAGGVAMANWFANAVAHNPNGGELIDVGAGTIQIGNRAPYAATNGGPLAGFHDTGIGQGAATADEGALTGRPYYGPDQMGTPADYNGPNIGSIVPPPGGGDATPPQVISDARQQAGVAPAGGGSGFFDGLRGFLNGLSSATGDSGADLGAGSATGF